MLGFYFALSSSIFGEVSDSIGKREMQKHKAGIYTVAFLSSIFAVLFFVFTAFYRGVFYFSMQSLPTLVPRIILEIILSYITMSALAEANRSSFGFIKTLTIPLLLVVDLMMGYTVDANQIIGMAVIASIVAFVGFSGEFGKKGLGLLLISAILPVATISIYKYDISRFNSVEAEQIAVSLFLLVFFFVAAMIRDRENPLKFLSKPVFLLQAVASGLSAVVGGFAYKFASPSIITTTLRGGAVLFSTLSGDLYFKEKRPLLKLLVAVCIIIGLLFLFLKLI
jgi:hypothetical protein